MWKEILKNNLQKIFFNPRLTIGLRVKLTGSDKIYKHYDKFYTQFDTVTLKKMIENNLAGIIQCMYMYISYHPLFEKRYNNYFLNNKSLYTWERVIYFGHGFQQ